MKLTIWKNGPDRELNTFGRFVNKFNLTRKFYVRTNYWKYRHVRKISFKLAWYDLWIGMFVDKRHNPLVTKYYICPFPCCLITIEVLK